MGIYIKDMEMPTSCPCELVGHGYDLHCSFVCGVPARVKEYYECCQHGTRPAWCPLIPVPEHGRMGDLDAAVEKLKRLREYHSDDSQSGVFIAHGISQCIEVLTGKDAPTIIPADKEGG